MCYTIVMMNEKVLHIVEFNKIIDQLTENANSEPARTLCRNLKPMDNLPDIRLAQEETDAALQLLIRKGNVNFGSNRDFGYTFGALSIGSTLTAAELLHRYPQNKTDILLPSGKRCILSPWYNCATIQDLVFLSYKIK